MTDGGHVCRCTGILFEGNILTKFQNLKTNPTSLGGDAISRNVYRRTVGRTDGQADAGEFPDRKESSSGLRPEELIISERAIKRALKFR